jgi:hypothetical protein
VTSTTRRGVLTAVLDRLIPDDGFPGAAALGLEETAAALVPELDELLARLEGFPSLDAEAQDAALAALADDPAFQALVAAAHAAFYADPRSWPAIGYTTNVPGRP